MECTVNFSLLAAPFTNTSPEIDQTMKTNLNYCMVLSSEQLAYQAGAEYGIDKGT